MLAAMGGPFDGTGMDAAQSRGSVLLRRCAGGYLGRSNAGVETYLVSIRHGDIHEEQTCVLMGVRVDAEFFLKNAVRMEFRKH